MKHNIILRQKKLLTVKYFYTFPENWSSVRYQFFHFFLKFYAPILWNSSIQGHTFTTNFAFSSLLSLVRKMSEVPNVDSVDKLCVNEIAPMCTEELHKLAQYRMKLHRIVLQKYIELHKFATHLHLFAYLCIAYPF